MRHLSTCCAAAPKLSHPPLCELPLKSVPHPHPSSPLPWPRHSAPYRAPYTVPLRSLSTPCLRCMSPYIIAPQMFIGTLHCGASLPRSCFLSLPFAPSLFLSLFPSLSLALSLAPFCLRPRISRADCDELLIVLCASSRNALFIFNHRTNTGRRPENMARHLFDDMCKQLAH